MKIRVSLATALAIGIAGGCSGAVRTQSHQDPSLYSFSTFTLYHGNRDTRVDVVADPVGDDSSAFAEAVTEAMYRANAGHPTRFTTKPGPSAEKNLKVIMAFNVAPHVHLCDARNLDPRPRVENTYLQAAWCWDNRTLSYVEARAPGRVRAGEPAFRTLVASATRDLFPQFIDNRLRDNNNDRRRRP